MAGNNSTILSEEMKASGSGRNQGADFLDAYTAATINDLLLCYIQPIISMFGIVGNILSFVILLKERKRHLSNNMLVGLASCDTFLLITKNYDVITCVAKQFDVIKARNLSVTMTPFMTFVPVVFGRVTGCITALLAMERLVAFTWPFSFKAWVTKGKISVAIAACYFAPMVFHIPVFLRNCIVWRYNEALQRELPYVSITKLYLHNKTFFDVWKNVVLTVAFYLLPVAIVMITTIITSIKIRRMSSADLRKDTNSSALATHRERRATVMLIIISVIYVLASLPGIAMLTARFVVPEFDFHGRYRNGFIVTTNINGLFVTLNSSVNFLVYCLAAESFRQSFLALFCSRCVDGNIRTGSSRSCRKTISNNGRSSQEPVYTTTSSVEKAKVLPENYTQS